MLEFCPLCHFRGTNRIQLCDHFKNSHPLELIRLMFSDRELFVYLSSSCKQYYNCVALSGFIDCSTLDINTSYDRIIIYRLEREMGKVLEELVVEPVALNVAQGLRPLVMWGKTQPEVAVWQKKEIGTETETETEEFDSLF